MGSHGESINIQNDINSEEESCILPDICLGDGVCDRVANTKECEFDRGDCEMEPETTTTTITTTTTPTPTTTTTTTTKTTTTTSIEEGNSVTEKETESLAIAQWTGVDDSDAVEEEGDLETSSANTEEQTSQGTSSTVTEEETCEGQGDGICIDEYNVEGCAFDGGDCCLPEVETFYCSDCYCHANSSHHTSLLSTRGRASICKGFDNSRLMSS